MAVAGADGAAVAVAGDPDRPVYARSSMKPLQAAVSLSLLAFDPPDEEVAVMCASHNGEPVHLEAVRSLLERAGVDEGALRCPASRPMDDEAFVRAPELRRINSDCSGKHAGMLGACAARGWPLETYPDPGHPLQRAVTEAVLAATGLGSVRIGVDGCGLPVHGMALSSLAVLYARLGGPGPPGPLAGHARRALAAMRAAPYLVAGRRRLDTAVMEQVAGVVVKSGAEGLVCAAVPARDLGIAVKVRDGGSRAAGPVLIRVLSLLGVATEETAADLTVYARPPVLGGGEPVGEIAVEVDLG